LEIKKTACASRQWTDDYSLGIEGCYKSVLSDDRCKVKNPFFYAAYADKNCGCSKEITCERETFSHTSLYEAVVAIEYLEIKKTACASRQWTDDYSLGIEGCYKSVLSDDRCKVKNPFFYTYGDKNCGCSKESTCERQTFSHTSLYEARSMISESPSCPTDNDLCLQESPNWGSSCTCSNSIGYCISWAKDMKRCCPDSCGTGRFTESQCLAHSGDGTCTYPNGAQCSGKR